MSWYFLGGLSAAVAFLVGRSLFRHKEQERAANAAGLVPVADLTHLPSVLQKTALWALSEGGFERRVVHGVVSRGGEDVDVTAFDLETHRERRGEWAWLPVDPAFRIGGVVSIVACEIDRVFPHCLFKRGGRGDQMIDDNEIEVGTHIAKLARAGLGLPRSHPAELPPTLPAAPLDLALPEHWRVYSTDAARVSDLLATGLAQTLERAHRRDLVVELLDGLVLVYPAARDVVGADAFADLTETALAVVDGVLTSSPKVTFR